MHDGTLLFARAARLSRGIKSRRARSRDHRPAHASSRQSRRLSRSCTTGLLAALLGFSFVAQSAGGPMCRPSLALRDVRFSELQPPAAERRWSTVVSVDASRCAANSQGQFDVVFSRIKEIGLEIEIRAQFAWTPPAVNVHVDFWAEEAVEVKRFWIDNITPCECGG
jgi:hypothetical protein